MGYAVAQPFVYTEQCFLQKVKSGTFGKCWLWLMAECCYLGYLGSRWTNGLRGTQIIAASIQWKATLSNSKALLATLLFLQEFRQACLVFE